MFKVSPQGSALKETLAFLLDHPRRCFTLLFPSSATWWLFAVLVILNLCDLFFFLVLDLGDAYILQIPVGYRILDGFFQAVSTRTAGFAVTNLELLHPAVLVSYLVMMYISIYPVAISIRRTNVYEERSLGIYAPEDEENPSFIGKVTIATRG
jgi:Trk-type K+ transport system membrane component